MSSQKMSFRQLVDFMQEKKAVDASMIESHLTVKNDKILELQNDIYFYKIGTVSTVVALVIYLTMRF